jgi:hypothetical protein
LQDVAEGPQNFSNASISDKYSYVEGLAPSLQKILYGMHPDDQQELLERAWFEKVSNRSNSVVNGWFSERIPIYTEYRKKEQSLQCDHSMWQTDGFQCPEGLRGIVGIQMLHLERDEWKMKRIQRTACMQGFEIDWPRSVWPGVIGIEHPEIIEHAVESRYILDPKGEKLGDAGAALAHITLWEDLQSRIGPTDIVLVMEDNALFYPESLSGMCASIKAAGDFDILLLNVVRPLGTTIDKSLGLRRVTKKTVEEPMPNVWLSSYLLTGLGASKLLKCMKSQPQHFGDPGDKRSSHRMATIIDHVVSQQCMSRDKSIKAFVVDHHRFFGHVETGGDSRRVFNSR